MIVVDSSVWVSYFREQPTPSALRLRSVRNGSRILVGDLILTELLQGARNDRHAEAINRYLRNFESVGLMGAGIAVRAAANYRHLRQRGITIRKTIDTIIATFCIENGHELLHQDRDFQPFVEHLGLREF